LPDRLSLDWLQENTTPSLEITFPLVVTSSASLAIPCGGSSSVSCMK
jgi:hypothetical protein